VFGTCLTVLFSSRATIEVNMDGCMELWRAPAWHAYLVVVGGVAFLTKSIHSKYEAAEHSDDPDVEPLPHSPLVLPITYAIFSALFGTVSVTQAKTIVLMLGSDTSDDNEKSVWGHWFFWATFVLFLGTVLIWLNRLNNAITKYNPMFIIPLFQASFIFFAIVSGGIFFDEFSSFDPHQWVGFSCGCCAIFGGLFLLSPNEHDEHDDDGTFAAENDNRLDQHLVSSPTSGGELQEVVGGDDSPGSAPKSSSTPRPRALSASGPLSSEARRQSSDGQRPDFRDRAGSVWLGGAKWDALLSSPIGDHHVGMPTTVRRHKEGSSPERASYDDASSRQQQQSQRPRSMSGSGTSPNSRFSLPSATEAFQDSAASLSQTLQDFRADPDRATRKLASRVIGVAGSLVPAVLNPAQAHHVHSRVRSEKRASVRRQARRPRANSDDENMHAAVVHDMETNRETKRRFLGHSHSQMIPTSPQQSFQPGLSSSLPVGSALDDVMSQSLPDRAQHTVLTRFEEKGRSGSGSTLSPLPSAATDTPPGTPPARASSSSDDFVTAFSFVPSPTKKSEAADGEPVAETKGGDGAQSSY